MGIIDLRRIAKHARRGFLGWLHATAIVAGLGSFIGLPLTLALAARGKAERILELAAVFEPAIVIWLGSAFLMALFPAENSQELSLAEKLVSGFLSIVLFVLFIPFWFFLREIILRLF